MESIKVERQLYSVFESLVARFDSQVKSVQLTQTVLNSKIDEVLSELQRVGEAQAFEIDLSPHICRLTNSKLRLVLANNIIQSAHERLSRLYCSFEADTPLKQAVVKVQHCLVDVAQQPR